jgi:hypothetical protein
MRVIAHTVAQIFNLMYRRFSTCRRQIVRFRHELSPNPADCKSAIRQITNLRYATVPCSSY